MISVPDLQTLASLYLDPSLTLQERWKVQQMMYGAQTDNHDYHFVSLSSSSSLFAAKGIGISSSFLLFVDD